MVAFAFLFFILVLFTLILPWIEWMYIRELRKEIAKLSAQVTWLISQARKKGAKVPKWEEEEPPAWTPPPPQPVKYVAEKQPTPKKVSQRKPKPASTKAASRPMSMEQRIAANLPVWIGGVALALAGFFLVKYSIETGLLSPTVRLLFGGVFGILLLGAGHWILNKHEMANHIRISQALSGAGIAVLYVCLYAASSVYTLISPLVGFIGMAVVTAIAVVLSLKQGPPIAILGLLGGFITPAMIEAKEPNAQFLFLYLYFVLAGLLTVIRQKNWWTLTIPVIIGAFLWVLIWIDAYFLPFDGHWLGLFLIAVSATVVFHSMKAMEEGVIGPTKTTLLNYLTLGGAVLLMTVIGVKSDFGQVEWGLYGALSAGGIVLSYYNKKLYGFVPWLAMIFNVIMLLAWRGADPGAFAIILTLFSLLFILSSYWLMWHGKKAVYWGILSGVSAVLYYTVAYGKFHNWVEGVFFAAQMGYQNPHVWSGLAFCFFILSVASILHVYNKFLGGKEEKQRLFSIFTLTATAFLSIGFVLELEQEFFRISLVVEILVLSWLSGHVNIHVLRPLAGAFSIFFGILLIPVILVQLLFLATPFVSFIYFFLSPYDPETWTRGFDHFQEFIPSIRWSLLQLGLPALLFGGASYIFRQQKDGALVRSFEVASIALLSLMTYYLVRHGFHTPEQLFLDPVHIIESSVISNLFFLYGLGCLWAGTTFKRKAVFITGLVLSCLAIARIFFFDILIYNPLWAHEDVGSAPIFNALLLVYGLPILWIFLGDRLLVQAKKDFYLPFTKTFAFVLVFFLVTLNIRQFYQGAYLDGVHTSDMEIYTYSIVWILMGLIFLFFGTLWQNKALRFASFAFVILSVGKVFLYDAAELTGLFRVFSFLGLGISLLGLSWFYTRFVFQAKKGK